MFGKKYAVYKAFIGYKCLGQEWNLELPGSRIQNPKVLAISFLLCQDLRKSLCLATHGKASR